MTTGGKNVDDGGSHLACFLLGHVICSHCASLATSFLCLLLLFFVDVPLACSGAAVFSIVRASSPPPTPLAADPSRPRPLVAAVRRLDFLRSIKSVMTVFRPQVSVWHLHVMRSKFVPVISYMCF